MADMRDFAESMAILKDLYDMANDTDSLMNFVAYSMEIRMTMNGIVVRSSANKKFIEDVAGKEWMDETTRRLKPVMEEQTIKLKEILKDKWGASFRENDETEELLRTAEEIFGKRG